MLCDICSKNQATVHLTEIVDEQMTELHLCEQCAKQKSVQMEQQFGLSDLLGGLVDFGKHVEGKEPSEIKCSSCGLSYEDFKKIGRLGCSNCYISFISYLTPLLKRIHGSSIHMGKSSQGATRVKVVRKLEPKKTVIGLEDFKAKLLEAIKLENFESAAILRDKIKALEEEKSSSQALPKTIRKKKKK
ncbi:UvrB/UvrC motif-containing protein [Candidatus Omnitrophota bacterium]